MHLRRALLMVMLVLTASGAGATAKDSVESVVARYSRDHASVNAINKLANENLKTNPHLARDLAYYTSNLSRELGYSQGYALSLNVIGNSYWYEGLYEFALNYYLLAARQYEKLGDKAGLGRVYNNMGEINKGLGLYSIALRDLEKSAELRENDSTLAITMYNIAELYILQNKYYDALEYIELSTALAKKYNDARATNYNNWSLGKIKIAFGKFDEGLSYFNKAIAGWKALSEKRALAQTYLDVAAALRKRGATRQAQSYVDDAFAILKELNIPDLRVQALLELSKLDSARGDRQGSIMNLNRHLLLKDSVYKLSKTEQVARLEVLYEAESRDRENEQLRVERSLKENELRSKEILLTVIAIGLLITLILLVILYRQRRRIMDNNKVLHFKNEEIKSQKESLELQAKTLIKLNEELNYLNKTLETRIEERSQQLLVQNQKLAEYSFVNAHKLRSPVASILGLIQLMKDSPPEEHEQIVKHLATCTEQLDMVVQEIGRNLREEQGN